MLKKVVEDYLESIREVDFFTAYSSLLSLKGYYDICITHGANEYGKDIIAKKSFGDSIIQYVFQIKVGDVGATKFKTEIMPQLLEASINDLSHPNYDKGINKQVVFVTTGTLNTFAAIAFQEFNNRLKDKYGFSSIQVVERFELIEDYLKYGIEPFFSSIKDPKWLGDFFYLYAIIKNNEPLDSFFVEKYTRKWMLGGNQSKYKDFETIFEAYLFSNLLSKDGRYYEALLIMSALVRYYSRIDSYNEHKDELSNYVNELAGSLVNQLNQLYAKGEVLVVGAANAAFLAPFKYAKMSLQYLEMLSLITLICGDDKNKLLPLIKRIIKNEKGWEHPISDNYAASVGLIGLALIQNSCHYELKKFLCNITIALCDKYENLGLSVFGASKQSEIEQVLSFHLEGFNYDKNKSSLIATFLLDIAYLADANEYYDLLCDELRASSVILQKFHVFDHDHLYGYDDIPCSYNSDYNIEGFSSHASGLIYDKNKCKISIRSKELIYLIFLLRDRLFTSFIKEIL